MKFVWKELQIIMSGELEAAQRLCQHLKHQESLIRQNKSKDLLASMRQANELTDTLNHYESQRVQWTGAHESKFQEIEEQKEQQDGFMDRLRNIGASLKKVLKEAQDRTLTNAELLGRVVERGHQVLQEIIKANGLTKGYGANCDEKTPSLFLDQRV